ncbi:CWC16 protein [Ochromonadaceae sp. CCMP2298]|nr:CWC16 protein [Ochromonadaceae sp. CCMP2298]|mmetsp:Transcript_18000/g.39910  ORF Transcript_18000/g.39910 Transcript_18000/m.39910 type:complete len:364 (+) Transcript_18000:179-1270(+)
MSSLAAARADNFYFPPEWTPEMGGLSKFAGSKGANQWEQYGIMRFELPFDAWCLKCEKHMSKGTRFNAKKEKEGKHFSTQIFSFATKCPACENPFKILTDPKNCTYDMKEGLRKHEQDYEPDGTSTIVTTDEARSLIANDPMYRLQHGEEDRRRALNDQERIDVLTDLADVHRNLYDRNSELRAISRKGKKRDLELAAEARQKGLGIALVEQSEQDAEGARQALFHKKLRPNFTGGERQRLANIQNQCIFQKDKRSRSKRESGSGSGSGGLKQYQHNSQLMAKAAALQIDSKALKLSSSQAAKPVMYLKPVISKQGKSGSGSSGRSSSSCSSSGSSSSGSSSVPSTSTTAKPAGNVLDLLAGY